jgi:magnesium-transporting ATPase (P-type)
VTTARPYLKQPVKSAWYLRSAEEVLTQLDSSATGLSLAEAARRLATDGPNELKEGARISPLQIFLGQFKSLIIWLLIAAGVISGVLVFAEFLRSFGARSESTPVWRISLFTNVNLVIVVAISFGLQVWSQHNATLGHFLKTSYMSLTDCLWLLALGAIPLIILEVVKVVRHARRKERSPFTSYERTLATNPAKPCSPINPPPITPTGCEP